MLTRQLHHQQCFRSDDPVISTGFLFQIQGIYLTLLSLPTAEETRKLALNVLRLIQSQRISFVCQPLILGYQPLESTVLVVGNTTDEATVFKCFLQSRLNCFRNSS